jgi:UDP:flavonoid glycosyltransferase YjiC (YdhE family)
MICLLANCAYLSETSRTIEIHRALLARGADVRVATHGGPHATLFDAAGIGYDVLGPPMDDRRSARFVADAVGRGDVRQSMYTDAELHAYTRAEAAYFAGHGVTAVFSGFALTALLSSRLVGVPVVTTHGSWVPPVWERGLLPEPADPPSRALRALPRPLLRRLTNAAPPHLRFYTAGFNRVAAALGVEPVPSLPALMLGDLALVTDLPQVLGVPAQAMAAWRPHGRRAYRPATRLAYTGPLYARLNLPLPDEVAAFLDGPDPVVYVALTSSPPSLVRGVVAALAPTGARILVAATVHALGDLASDRIMVGGVLPSHLVMPRVDLAVTTAGQGSIQTALAAATPVLGVPLHGEQDLNVVLAERLGAARRVARSRAATPALTAVARQMLDDDSYRRAAARIRQWYAAVDGPGATADAILALSRAVRA